ncbi:MAG: protein kinase [Desulfohalobiaceae bacterium]
MPMRISRYQVLGLLGRGGTGRVYKVLRPELKKVLALKLLRPDEVLEGILGREELERRFWREARIMGELEQENIASAWDAGEHRGEPFLVLEYMGMNLGRLIGESDQDEAPTRPVPPVRALSFLEQALYGLARLHREGIVHLDLKPANLLLTSQDRVKLIDFGLAGLPGLPLKPPKGLMIGSAAYASPEQQTDPDAADARADLYSAGVVLHRLATGALPEKNPDVSDHPLLGPEWTAFFRRALQVDPAERFASAWHMLEHVLELRRQWEGRRNTACPSGALQGPRDGSEARAKPRSEPMKTGHTGTDPPFPGLNGLMQPERAFPSDIREADDGYLDRANGLIWAGHISAFPAYWDRCGEHLPAGKGWRLPTVEELITLLRPKRTLEDFCAPDPWGAEARKWVWSADLRTASQAWLVDLEQGAVIAADRTCLLYVLPVRDAD